MKVEVAVLGSPSLISLMVSVNVKHHERISRHCLVTFSRPNERNVKKAHLIAVLMKGSFW